MEELFANIFDNDEWREKVHDPSTYPQKNGGHFARGDSTPQVWEAHPWVKDTFMYTEYEMNYDPEPLLTAMKQNNYMIPIGCVVAYVAFVFWLGPKWIEARGKPFDLKYPMALWNLSLSLFSFWGASRTVPHLIWRLNNETYEDSVCISPHKSFGGSAVGLATQMFILSKIPELFDTVFMVLKKKPVIFLHWYHHITVLLYCWNSYVTESGAGLYFVSMNYCVHAMMYFYFFLMALRSIPQWYNPFPLTVFQITQMVVGTTVVSSCIYYHNYGSKEYKYYLGTQKCHNLISNLYAGGIMYASYLYLFCEFAVKRFFFGINDYAKKPNFRDTSTSATTKENKKTK